MSGATLPATRRDAFLAVLRDSLPPASAMAYVARTLLAVSIALYVAYALQLDSPASAGTTVLIVANASQGALVSKSVWRLVGSFLGVIAAIVIVASFAQAPFLFTLALACWVGLCTMMASAFRYNRGYAGVLAGYTVAIVALPAIAAPDQIFDLALSRLSVVSLGVVIAGLVFMLTEPGKGPTEFQPVLLKLLAGTCRMVAKSFEADSLATPRAARSAMAADIAALDQLVEFAAAAEAGFSRYADDVRLAAAQLIAMLTGGLRMAVLLHDLHHPDDRAAAAVLRNCLGAIGESGPGMRAAALAARAGEAREAVQHAIETTQDLTAFSGFDQALTLLDQMDEAIATLVSLEARRPRRTTLKLRFFVEWQTARRNGIRAILAISIAGLFWIESQWSSGANMLLIISVTSALFTQGPSASAMSIAFLKGVTAMVIASFFCSFAILPRMSGFPLLLLGLLPFILVALVAQRVPRYAGAATAYVTLILSTVSPSNPMVFDLSASLNGDLALLAGVGLAALAFRVLLPPNPLAEANAIADNLRRSSCKRPANASLAFEHIEHQKLLRMSQRLAGRPDLRSEAVGEAVVAVLIGRQLQKIRAAAADAALPLPFREMAARAARNARNMHVAPQEIVTAYASDAAALGLAAQGLPQRRLAASLREAALLVEYDAPFLRGNGVLTA